MRNRAFSLFRLLSGIGNAIICVVSRKAILETLIFDTGGSRKIAAVGLESWKMGEFGSEGLKPETRNSKPETNPTDRQNLLPPWHTSTTKWKWSISLARGINENVWRKFR